MAGKAPVAAAEVPAGDWAGASEARVTVAADAATRTAQAIFFIPMISRPEQGEERQKGMIAYLLLAW